MNHRILLVEDNASDEKLTLLAFKNCGVPNEISVDEPAPVPRVTL